MVADVNEEVELNWIRESYVTGAPILRLDPLGLDLEAGGGFGTDGSVGIGGGVGGGAYAGLGGEFDFSIEIKWQDCCKDGQLIKKGQRCEIATATGEVGIGIGKKGKVGGIGVGATGKLATVGASAQCQRCNKCGTSLPTSKCCITVFLELLSGDVNLGIIKFELTVLTLKCEVCIEDGNLKHGPDADWLGGKGGLAGSSGGSSSGGAAGGGSSGGGE